MPSSTSNIQFPALWNLTRKQLFYPRYNLHILCFLQRDFMAFKTQWLSLSMVHLWVLFLGEEGSRVSSALVHHCWGTQFTLIVNTFYFFFSLFMWNQCIPLSWHYYSKKRYMRGRLTLEKVNAAINDMASYAEANAHLIAASKQKVYLHILWSFTSLRIWVTIVLTFVCYIAKAGGKSLGESTGKLI